MKKFYTILIFFIFSVFNLSATSFPENLIGIWEGKDRFIFLDNNFETGEAEIVIFLKEYYGWYIDRTAEPDYYDDIQKRTRNAGTTRYPVPIVVSINSMNKNIFPEDSEEPEPFVYNNVFELELEYSKYQKNKIPVAVLDNKIYLDFFVQDFYDKNLYRGNIASKGLLVSEQYIPENIGALYLNKENLSYYDIRYWKTDMDYEDSKVLFSRNGIEFLVDKHLISGGQKYSCVNGRSKKIRNPQPPLLLDENFIFSEDESLLVRGIEPYLYKLVDHKGIEDLFKIVNHQNSQRKPDPAPLFPQNGEAWHWNMLEFLLTNSDIIEGILIRNLGFPL